MLSRRQRPIVRETAHCSVTGDAKPPSASRCPEQWGVLPTTGHDRRWNAICGSSADCSVPGNGTPQKTGHHRRWDTTGLSARHRRLTSITNVAAGFGATMWGCSGNPGTPPLIGERLLRTAVESDGILLEFHGSGVELVVLALLGDELVVGAALDDVAVVEHHDHVGVAHGGQAVGDHEDGAALH